MKLKYIDSILLKNNILTVWEDKNARFRVIFIPLLICVLIPVLLTVSALIFKDNLYASSLRIFLPESLVSYNNSQTIHYVSTNFICSMLFPIVPIIVSSSCASVCLIGEKENKTIFSLLSTPISPYHIIRNKYLSCALLSLGITLISAFCFFITACVGNILFSTSFFFDLTWAINFFLFPLAISLFCPLVLTIFFSHFDTKESAMKFSYFIVFFLLMFYMLEFTGAYKITSHTLLILTGIIYLIDIILIFIAKNRFKPELLIDYKEE